MGDRKIESGAIRGCRVYSGKVLNIGARLSDDDNGNVKEGGS